MNQSTSLRESGLIVLSHLPYGGITDYLHHQANALVELGMPVEMVGPTNVASPRGAKYTFNQLWRQPTSLPNRFVRRALFGCSLVANMRRFAKFIETREETNVLLGGFFEYLAPLWAQPFQRLAANGKRFFTIIHDPVRDFVVGPLWWHKHSIRQAYSFVHTGFVHGPVEAVQLAGEMRLISIPIGTFMFPQPTNGVVDVRRQLGISETSKVILSFGHLRDGKNIDLLMNAIIDFRDVHLIVAGKEQSQGQRPEAFYKQLAKDLKIQKRCHFEIRFIEDDEIGGFFKAADIVAMTYSADFRSASSALGACVAYRVPCIASSGAGPLKEMVEKYGIGVWVEPDSVEAIRLGLKGMLRGEQKPPNWDDFEHEYSWENNAASVKSAILNAD